MKCFAFGFVGFFIAALLLAIIYPAYSNYRADAEIDGWCAQLTTTVHEIDNALRSKDALPLIIRNIQPAQITSKYPITHNTVLANGTIMIQGGVKNQLLVLVPTFDDNNTYWDLFVTPTVGGRIPGNCRRITKENREKRAEKFVSSQ